MYSFGADINYRTLNGECAMSLARQYGRHNVISRLSSNLNTKLNGWSGVSYSKPIQHLNENPKSVIHYESENVKADRNRIKVGLRNNEKLVSNKQCYKLAKNIK